jgi:hypothetical protein
VRCGVARPFLVLALPRPRSPILTVERLVSHFNELCPFFREAQPECLVVGILHHGGQLAAFFGLFAELIRIIIHAAVWSRPAFRSVQGAWGKIALIVNEIRTPRYKKERGQGWGRRQGGRVPDGAGNPLPSSSL